jgi:hypothetical protein
MNKLLKRLPDPNGPALDGFQNRAAHLVLSRPRPGPPAPLTPSVKKAREFKKKTRIGAKISNMKRIYFTYTIWQQQQ